MGNPFEITPEHMREMGYQVIDALVDYWQNLPESKIGARATRDELESLLRVAPPEQGEPFEAVLS
ncbi:MAG: decarboxylase, partial [Fimbriimonadia bacterium]|nr:decarboxylase [Fimbriimonadia bacterium]